MVFLLSVCGAPFWRRLCVEAFHVSCFFLQGFRSDEPNGNTCLSVLAL